MNLHLEILEINNSVDNYENQTVKFAIYDDEESGLVSFIDKINVAHAWFFV